MLEVTKPKEITPLSSSKVSPIYRPHEARHQQAETEEKESSHHKSKSSSRKKKQKKSSSNEESNEGRKEKKEERKERKEKKEKKERKERKEKKSSTFSESSVAPDEEEKRRNSSSWQNIFNCQESCPTTPRLDEQSSSKKEDNSSTASTAFSDSDSNGTPDDEKRMMQIDSGEYSCVPPASALTRMVGAASDVKRSEMKIIIGSIRRDRKEYIKQRSSNSLEETVHRVEEQRKALLVKWQAMSDQRKASGLSSAFLLIDYDKK